MNAMALRPEGRSLTSLEWQVVQVAKSDGPRSIAADGRLDKYLRIIFGRPGTRTLANDKLEALRRFCVCAWHRDSIRIGELWMLVEAGYSARAVFQVIAYVARNRGLTSSVQEQSA